MHRARPMRVLPILAVTGCALNADVGVVDATRAVARGGECPSPPRTERTQFRRFGNSMLPSLGAPRHRGIDLVAMESDENQTLGGKLAYTAADSDIEGEDVELFACVDAEWRVLGTERTDRHGRFAHVLSGSRRLPVGMRDLFAHVPGDGTGVRFLAYVAPAGTTAIAVDIDGTLTESENAILNTVVFGDDIAPQPGAAAALQALAAAGRPIVYLTARGDQFTELTRLWLRIHRFPRGPLRLARETITPPGPRTVEFKARALQELAVPVAAGIGNRATDVAAYTRAGLPADRIFINLPEFADELRSDLAAKRATPFDHYRDLIALLPAAGR